MLAQDFHIQRPNLKWLVDITYIATGEGWLYQLGLLVVHQEGSEGYRDESLVRAWVTSNCQRTVAC